LPLPSQPLVPQLAAPCTGQPGVAPAGLGTEQAPLPLQVRQAPQLVPLAAGSQVPPLHVPE
jgi:hypothetical protein